MDQALRDKLYTPVVRCRQALEADFRLQLEGHYGVHADGHVEPLAGLTHLDAVGRADRRAIEAALAHEQAAGASRVEALARFVRESAFTCLNRLAGLKLMEDPSRALILPAIGQGQLSKGFQQFALVSPEAMRGQPDGGYRLYLEMLFDDLAQALGVLFDRSLPTSILFPSPACLADVLARLNDPALADAWRDDETIGWVYQYFTPKELRDQARKASAAPRTSDELAFRNQFYTPRYVVAFLTDNSLGRLWWEMRQGDTRLAEECRFLVRRPTTDHRPREKRDPRSLRVLDPACGSGHFLLYAFDLLLTIYDEAYDDPDLGPALQRDFPDRAAFRRAAPRLIVEHNLHGIDIDLRACQIATLALWLRAQRAWADQGVKRRDRPRVQQAHIVCAEAMPGEYDLLGEFVRDLEPAVLGNVLRDVWQWMQPASEAGSLLRIEAEVRASIQRARRALEGIPQGVQIPLFDPRAEADEAVLPPDTTLRRADLDNAAFWNDAEARVVEALHAYARDTRRDLGVTRALFAHDAEQGLAFIDVLRRRYDVALMNPPFGAASVGSKAYLERAYPRTKNDLYAAFVERGLSLLWPGGYLGAITSRTGFFLTSFQRWREEILLQEAELVALADLGYGVLDTAMVETAAYVLRKR